MQKKIVLNDKEVCYEFQRKNVKNINLRIKADQSIYLSANKCVSEKTIESFLVSKADLILNALSRFEQLEKQSPKQYKDGEIFEILGYDRTLKVVEGAKNTVQSDNSCIILTVKDIADIALKKQTLEKWLKQQCREVVTQICRSIYPKFEGYGIPFP